VVVVIGGIVVVVVVRGVVVVVVVDVDVFAIVDVGGVGVPELVDEIDVLVPLQPKAMRAKDPIAAPPTTIPASFKNSRRVMP